MYSLERVVNHFHLLTTKKRPTGYQALMVNYPLYQLAVAMMASFGVLFIYLLGDSFVNGLSLVLMFFGLQRIMVAISELLIVRLVSKIGYRWTILFSLVCLIAKTFLLMKVTIASLWMLGPALLFGGLAIAAYYSSYHGIFLTDNDDDKIGQQLGLVTMMGRMGATIAPLIAGLLIQNYSYSTMFGVAIILLFMSSVPLFLMPHHDHKEEKFRAIDSYKLMKKKEGFLDSISWWIFENGIQSFWWPILLFSLVGSFAKFGMIGSGVMVANSLAVYVTGKIYDKRKLRRVYPVFTGLVAVSNVLRYSSKTMMMGVGSDAMNRMMSPFWWMKIRRNALVDGENYSPMVFAVAWEWAVCWGYITSLIVGYLILVMSGGQWQWLMVPAVVANVIAAVGVRKDE